MRTSTTFCRGERHVGSLAVNPNWGSSIENLTTALRMSGTVSAISLRFLPEDVNGRGIAVKVLTLPAWLNSRLAAMAGLAADQTQHGHSMGQRCLCEFRLAS